MLIPTLPVLPFHVTTPNLPPAESSSGSCYMNCKSCGRNYGQSACNNYIRATVMIEVEDSNKPPQKVAIFKPQIEKLFTSRGFKLLLAMTKLSLSSNSLK